MAKAKRGLLLSLLALLFAVTLTATSTYAWFVVNTEVTASNMQVTVKSDTTFLVISSTSTLADATTLSLTAASPKDVLPTKYDSSSSPESGYEKWVTARSNAYDSATQSGGYTNIATASLANYVVHYQFYIGITSTTANHSTNLRVKSLAVTNTAASSPDNVFMPAVSVLFKYNDGTADHIADCTDANGLNGCNQSTCNAFGTLVSDLTPGTAYLIDAYVYINGDNAVVKSSNASHIATFAVEAHFEVTAG